ncbi:MAG: hypothetical protein HYU51_10290 [Candidatus Rokubacteria bacterium]|nr:hypothetical protein [Candidatus Rokubacteria bacterium]
MYPILAYVIGCEPDLLLRFGGLCPYVGGPLIWDPGSGSFTSPCRGSVFDHEGRVLAGPAPRPLDRHAWKVKHGVLYAGRFVRQG